MLYVMSLYPPVTKDNGTVTVPTQGFFIITTLVTQISFRESNPSAAGQEHIS